jgi:hypothetical protein
MARYPLRRLLWNIACCVLVFCLLEFRPLLIGGCLKLIASLAFACLLAFVVVHSPDIYKLVTACLQALPSVRCPLFVDRRWAARFRTSLTSPTEPSLTPLFQRPPPIFLS